MSIGIATWPFVEATFFHGLLSPITVAVSGGRSYSNARCLNGVLSSIHKLLHIHLIIQGECHVEDGGADELARLWARKNQINCLSVPAKSLVHGWPKAGPMRNMEMSQWAPDLWVLFPGGAGTASARTIAREKAIRIIEVKE